MNTSQCPICGGKVNPLPKPAVFRDGLDYDCQNCGRYFITASADDMLKNATPKIRAVLSHAVCQRQEPGKTFWVAMPLVESASKEELPDLMAQIDLVILYHGRHQGSISTCLRHNPDNLRAKLCVPNSDDVWFIYKVAEEQGLIERYQMPPAVPGGRLTMKGWQRFREIERGIINSKTVFMAMSYKNSEVAEMVDNVFRRAVRDTGFKLKRLDDEPEAGLIDDRMRVEIRTCRFLIADLTDGNQGAYWEAGYAEGLDKKVIYTCEKGYFDKEKTHFDANHRQTVVWTTKNPEQATIDLMATIRATFPFDAKMPDE